MNRDNIIYKTIRIILTGFTLATVLAVSLGSVDIFTAGLLNYAVFLEYLYGIVITVGIVVVLVKLWMFPNIKDGITLKEARTCRLIANIFLIEFLCELIHGALSNKCKSISFNDSIPSMCFCIYVSRKTSGKLY